MIFRSLAIHIIIYSVDHRRSKFLAAESVSAACDLDVASAALAESCDHVEIQRLAGAAAFFYSVKHSDSLYACRYCVCKHFCSKRTEKSDFEHAVLAALSVEIIYRLADGFRAAAHYHNNGLRVLRAVILIRLILSACDSLDVSHSFFDYLRHCIVIAVASFAVLEIDIGVLSRTLLNRMFRVERTLAEFVDIRHILFVDGVFDVDVVDDFYLGHFVRSSESVEEVHKWHFCFECGQVSNKRKVHNFLYGVGTEHCKSRLTACHYVGVVSEDVERVVCQSSRADVEYARREFACDLIHIWDHKEKSLACRKSGGQCACHKRAVNSACRACL